MKTTPEAVAWNLGYSAALDEISAKTIENSKLWEFYWAVVVGNKDYINETRKALEAIDPARMHIHHRAVGEAPSGEATAHEGDS